MAFTAALRRASSAAIRALGSRQVRRSSALLDPLPLRPFFSRVSGGCGSTSPCSFVRFSSSSELNNPASDTDIPKVVGLALKSADADLLKVIDSEIKCAEESDDHDRVEEIPEGFPFEVQDEKGKNVIILKRTYQNENIEVIVSMPSLVTGEEPENDRGRDGEDDEDGDDAGSEQAGQSSLPLIVTVTKAERPILEFSCTAYPDEVVIDSTSVRENTQTEEASLAYEGPDFNDLDENLQKGFHKYLELRGISALNTNFLHEYMINKDSQEYLLWLKNLKQFIQK